MAAVLQMEFDRKRFEGMSRCRDMICRKTYPINDAWAIALSCVDDTMKHGGTFVLVVGPQKITLVQREEAEKL